MQSRVPLEAMLVKYIRGFPAILPKTAHNPQMVRTEQY